MALWRIEPLEARDKNMAEHKKSGSLPAVLTYDDVLREDHSSMVSGSAVGYLHVIAAS